MGDKSSIAWCHKTFNPIIGCAAVTSACKNCYAEQYANRYGLAKWGIHGTRHITSDSNWKKPLSWNKEAAKLGVRYRVFCASLSDFMEEHITWTQVRERLWALVEATPHLDWMFLTKRPENFERFFPERWLKPGMFPQNIWLGTTIADQKDYDGMFPHLRSFCSKHKVKIMWLSCEPLLGRIKFDLNVASNHFGLVIPPQAIPIKMKPLDLIIIGGESGFITKIRKLDLNHVKYIIDQFQHTSNPPKIFFKQLGSILAKEYKLADTKGETFDQYPHLLGWLKRREMPLYENEFK